MALAGAAEFPTDSRWQSPPPTPPPSLICRGQKTLQSRLSFFNWCLRIHHGSIRVKMTFHELKGLLGCEKPYFTPQQDGGSGGRQRTRSRTLAQLRGFCTRHAAQSSCPGDPAALHRAWGRGDDGQEELRGGVYHGACTASPCCPAPASAPRGSWCSGLPGFQCSASQP